jgi:hypothetical protein
MINSQYKQKVEEGKGRVGEGAEKSKIVLLLNYQVIWEIHLEIP